MSGNELDVTMSPYGKVLTTAPLDGGQDVVVQAGEAFMDEQLTILVARYRDKDWSQICSELDQKRIQIGEDNAAHMMIMTGILSAAIGRINGYLHDDG